MNEIIKSFYSEKNLYDLEIEFKTSQKTIRKIWYENFGKNAVKERGKGRNTKDIDLTDEFYSTKPLSTLAKEYNLDYRTIKNSWLKTFSKQDIKNRRTINARSFENSNFIEKIHSLVYDGKSAKQIANSLSVSKSVVLKYISINDNVRKKNVENDLNKKSDNMKKLRLKDKITDEISKQVMSYFDSDLFPYEIANFFNIKAGSIRNIFIRNAGTEKYKERVFQLEKKRVLRCFKGLELAGRLGSKRELDFYSQLSKRISVNVVHHDYELVPPYEIDITIPELKIAINWDGIGHFKPIFGEENLKIVQHRDKYKLKVIREKGWKAFVINDLASHYNMELYKEQHDRFDEFLKKLGYGDYIDSEFKIL